MYGVYGMVAPLCVILDAMHEVFPGENARLVVVIDGAHATGTGVIWALEPSLLSRHESHICLSCRAWALPCFKFVFFHF